MYVHVLDVAPVQVEFGGLNRFASEPQTACTKNGKASRGVSTHGELADWNCFFICAVFGGVGCVAGATGAVHPVGVTSGIFGFKWIAILLFA